MTNQGTSDARTISSAPVLSIEEVRQLEIARIKSVRDGKEPKRVSAETREYFTLIAAAQFYYRNYQDEALYATTARYLASGRGAWHQPQYGQEILVRRRGVWTPQGTEFQIDGRCKFML